MVAKNRVVPLLQRPMLPEIDTLIRWLVFALVFFLFIWPSYGELKMAGVPNLAPPRLLKTGLFFLLGVQFVFHKLDFGRISEVLSRNWVFFLSLLMYHILRISSFVMDADAATLLYSYIKEELFTNLLVLFFLLYSIREMNHLEKVANALVLVLIPLSCIVVIESILKTNLFSMIVSDANLGTELAFVDKSRDMAYRAHGSFGHPLLLAQYCACIFPITIWVWRRGNGVMKYLSVVAAVCSFVSMLLTNTRSGQVFMLFAIVLSVSPQVMSWWKSCRDGLKKLFIFLNASWVIIGGAVASYLWISELVLGRTYEESHSSFARLDMLISAVPKIISSPLIGYGPTHALDGVGFYSKFGRFIDNYFLLVGLQSGLVAVCLLIGVFVFLAKGVISFPVLVKNDNASKWQEMFVALSSSVLLFMGFQIVHASSELLPLLYILMSLILLSKYIPSIQSRPLVER